MRRPAAAINKKFKIIPGHLKMDIQQPAENLPCCLTSNLFEVGITEYAVIVQVVIRTLYYVHIHWHEPNMIRHEIYTDQFLSISY